MPRKLTQEEIDQYLNTRGFRMLEPYVNTRHRHTFACSNGHTWSTTINSVKNQGDGCPHCSNKAKWTQDKVESYLATRGFTLVGKYLGALQKHTFECSYNHQWSATFNNIKDGNKGCPICHNKGLASTKLYVMFSNSCGTKIGISHRPEHRIKDIQKSGNIQDLTLVKVYHIDNFSYSKKLESLIHQHFKDSNAGYTGFDGATEFFNITPEDAIDFINSNLP